MKNTKSIKQEILHCEKMINKLKNSDLYTSQRELLHRFTSRLSELQTWIKNEKATE